MKQFGLVFSTIILPLALLNVSAAAQARPEISLTGEVLLGDLYETKGELEVTIEGSKLIASASYPVDNYPYASMRDSFEASIDGRGVVEGRVIREIQMELSEATQAGPGRTLARVKIRHIGRFDGSYRDGVLQARGRIYDLDRDPEYEVLYPDGESLAEIHRRQLEDQTPPFMFFTWSFPSDEN